MVKKKKELGVKTHFSKYRNAHILPKPNLSLSNQDTRQNSGINTLSMSAVLVLCPTFEALISSVLPPSAILEGRGRGGESIYFWSCHFTPQKWIDSPSLSQLLSVAKGGGAEDIAPPLSISLLLHGGKMSTCYFYFLSFFNLIKKEKN